MDSGVAIILVHHVGKTSDVREPEDLWRGASRLADWASTRITMLPHYSAAAAKKLDMGRHIARTHADLHFLRRGEPVEDFSIKRGADGWWRRWEPTDNDEPVAGGISARQVASYLGGQPGATTAQVAGNFGVAHATATRLLKTLEGSGIVVQGVGERNANTWRLGSGETDTEYDPF
jgi:hypothetical protein